MASGNPCDNRCIVEQYLKHKLWKNGEENCCVNGNGDDRESVHRALREAGDELERLYRPDLADMTKQLMGAPDDSEQRRFLAVADELFRDGINWGRVVAFLEFGAAVCVQCAADRERSACAENVACWMAEYLNGPLSGWIQDNGGWDGFVELYSGQKNSVLNSSWPSMTTSIFSLAALGVVGLTIGAYLAQK